MKEKYNALPLNISDFPSMQLLHKIYVDKTDAVYDLAYDPGRFYFLSRPRRFGKTLLVSTFESLFENGLRDFKGTAIEKRWNEQDPLNSGCLIMHFDFSGMAAFASREEFEAVFYNELDNFMAEHPVEENRGFENANSVINRFKVWLQVRQKCALRKLVVLIDEYDAPLNVCLDRPELFGKIAGVLANFYQILKAHSGAIRFMFITGICRFRHTTIFSGFNSLTDITMNSRYGTLLGYTKDELVHYFGGYIDAAAASLCISSGECLERMTENYDGFCFDEKAQTHVFSPWSVLNFLDDPMSGFKNYWYDSAGRATVLMNYIKGHAMMEPSEYVKEHVLSTDSLSAAADLKDLNNLSLLTQAGYFSIKGTTDTGDLILNYPNLEVASSMARLFTDTVVDKRQDLEGLNGVFTLGQNVDAIAARLNAVIGRVSYRRFPITDEFTLQQFLHICLMSVGLRVDTETVNNLGRSDLEVAAGRYFYVIELKFARAGDDAQKLLEKAAAQIENRRYGEHNGQGLEHVRLAMVFSEKERQFVRFTAC